MKKIIILSASILFVGIFAVLKSANPGSAKGVVESKMVIVKTYEGVSSWKPEILIEYGDAKFERIELDPTGTAQSNRIDNLHKIHTTLNNFISQGYHIQTSGGENTGYQYILIKE